MKNVGWIVGLLSLSFFLPAALSAGEVLTNEDVVALHEAGLPGSVIVAKIQESETDFDTSVETLVALAESGLPDAVITAMVKGGGGEAQNGTRGSAQPGQTVVHSGRFVEQRVATAAPTVASNFAGTPCPSPGIFARSRGDLTKLEPSSYTGTKTSGLWKSALTYGALSVKSKAMIAGMTSHNRIDESSPTFYFCFEETESGLSYETEGATTPSQFLLVTLDAKEKQQARLLVTGKLNSFTGGYAGPPPKYREEFTYEKLAPGVYEVVARGLGPGEYAFFYTGSASTAAAATYGLVSAGGGGKVFDFAVY